MISKTSLQAIKALTELARISPGQCEGAAAIAKRINAPANYLGKLLQSLVSHGLVTSQRGMGGGFRLNKAPDKISLFDIVNCIEDVNKWSRCFLGRAKCSDDAPCSVHDRWKGVREANIQFLKGITLADLAR